MNNRVKVTANKELFDAWWLLGERVTQLKGIVQNDMELGSDEYYEWRKEFFQVKNKLIQLGDETKDYILGLKKDQGVE